MKEKQKLTPKEYWNGIVSEIMRVYIDLVQLSIRLIGMSFMFGIVYTVLSTYNCGFWESFGLFALAVLWHSHQNKPNPPKEIKLM